MGAVLELQAKQQCQSSLESKLIHLIHRVLFASQTASVTQSLWKSAADFDKRLSLLFFGFKHTQKRFVIVKRTGVKYILLGLNNHNKYKSNFFIHASLK